MAAWLLLLALVVTGLVGAGTALSDDFSIPGTQAQNALDDLRTTFPQSAGGAAQIVIVSDSGAVTGSDTQDSVRRSLQRIAGMNGVASVTDPYTGARVTATGVAETPPLPPSINPVTVSEDGSTAYAQVQFADVVSEVPDDLKSDVQAAMDPVASLPGFEVFFGGQVFEHRGLEMSLVDVAGVLLALLVLALTFRSFVASVLPIGTALIGVAVATGGLMISSNVISVSSSAPSLGMMIGLAVGIDYALFIISRYRELLSEGRTLEDAAARATATAGSAVVFAGATVVIALAGLSIAGIPFLTVMGLGAAAAVVVAVLIAVTLIPALLGIAGDRLRPRPKKTEDATPEAGTVPEQRVAERWANLVTRHKILVTTGVVLLLMLVAVPATSLRLALPDGGDQAAGSTQRRAHEVIAEKFGPGYNGPLTISADLSGAADPAAAVAALADDLAAVEGVRAVKAAVVNPDTAAAVFSVVPDWPADDPATGDLVNDIRNQAGSRAEWSAVDVAVTGPTAVSLDTSRQLAEALIPFGFVVVGLSLLLLLLVFRSLWVPLIASLGYLLSTAAAFGAVSAVFEHGFLAGPLGVKSIGPVISFLPIVLMGVLFGLAMDYQVFLVTRIREQYVHGQGATAAIKSGIRQSGKVIVAAAAIMIGVFAAFIPTGDAVLQPIAFGLAVGVLFDAFLVRLALVPAVLAILGDRAWRLPAWIDRLLPDLDVEGAGLDRGLDEKSVPAPAGTEREHVSA
ncbi:MAG: MMPL family transporter [Umezawaea sp.]